MTPTFVFVMTNGDVWVSSQIDDTPTRFGGTIAGTFRIAGGSRLVKVGSISGANPYSVSFVLPGAGGKFGREVGGNN